MYKIIGADNQPYGPVTAEQIRQWIVENRANGQTLIQPEGASEWKPLGSFPEFADTLAGNTPHGAPPPIRRGTADDADRMAAEILARDYHLDIGSCISRSWKLLTQHFWLLVGATFVLSLIQGAIGLFVGVCMGGLYFLYLKLIRGERAEFGDAFSGFSLAFLQLFLAGIVTGLLTGVGIMLCLLPGIYLAIAWMFAAPLVIDKHLEFWPAMELSRRVVSRHWWTLFALVLVNALIALLGFLACFVGVFIAQAVMIGALAYAYEDIFGSQRATGTVSRPAL